MLNVDSQFCLSDRVPRASFQSENQNPGAYSIPGTGERTQNDSIPYTVTVPPGVRPGQEFQVMAGGLPMVVSGVKRKK